MTQARQISLFLAITSWAALVGAILYSHIVFFPGYLSHLPESNKIITDFDIQDGNFWMTAHPITILSTVSTFILNWKLKTRRKFILITLGIYVVALIATIFYFLPNLMLFADSMNSTVSPAEWYKRGQTWQHLSWIRGSAMIVGFVLLLVALTKDN
ncbi:hypothetical protein [Terrimonas pollutisoli]|uniref:hypothetical protein n=1 Tax=Terrimonas pollutisoli TaxID=3034147 RepID=UPI0023ED9BA8|nr:hypothetical protein [Terrimonas sp. H1YJ31]